jgi:hypothetical protein
MKRLLKMIMHNWWLKLLAVGMAWLLWSVVTQGAPVETGFLVSLGLRHLPENLRVEGELPTPVYVQLRGPERLVEGLRQDELGVTIDLEGTSPGEREIVLLPEHARVPPGVEVVGFIPTEVRIRLVVKKPGNNGKK